MSQEVSDEGDNREVREWRCARRMQDTYDGARRLVIDFDTDYKSCSLKVSLASESGTCNIIRGHDRREIRAMAPLAPSSQ